METFAAVVSTGLLMVKKSVDYRYDTLAMSSGTAAEAAQHID